MKVQCKLWPTEQNTQIFVELIKMLRGNSGYCTVVTCSLWDVNIFCSDANKGGLRRQCFLAFL